jgi:hypothetical protein
VTALVAICKIRPGDEDAGERHEKRGRGGGGR